MQVCNGIGFNGLPIITSTIKQNGELKCSSLIIGGTTSEAAYVRSDGTAKFTNLFIGNSLAKVYKETRPMGSLKSSSNYVNSNTFIDNWKTTYTQNTS